MLGHEGAGVVERVGDGVTSVAPGDHVVTLFSPQCRECIHCQSDRTNLCLAIREQQNKGYLPDGTTRLSIGGEPVRHFMGTSTFAEYTVMPEIALAKVDKEAPLDGAALFACGLSTGIGAAMNTAKVEAGSTCVVFGAGMVGLGAVIGCRLQAPSGSSASTSRRAASSCAKHHGATETMVGGEDAVERIVESTGGFGADYTFEATGNVAVMRQAVESARMGWGLLHRRGRRRQGRDARRRPALPDHGPARGRLVVRRRQGPRRRAAARRSAGSPARSTSESLISHRLTLDEVNRGFELMEAQDGIRSVIEFS